MTPELRRQRADYLVAGRCAVCGGLAHDVHEIIAGANRQAAIKEPACWLRVCRTCHNVIQGLEVEYQLAVKLVSEPETFSLPTFCKAWRRAESAVNVELLVCHVRAELLLRKGLRCQ